MTKRKSIEEFKNEVYNIYKEEYTVLSEEYINNKTPILIRHNCESCNNYEYYTKPNNILSGKKCPICANKIRGEKSRRDNYLNNLLNNAYDGEEYEWLQQYNYNNKEKLLIKHKKCGEIYKVRPNDFQQGYRCPFCCLDSKSSKNYNIIKEYLINKNLNCEYEVSFKECKDKRVLPFDIKVNNLILEIDGSQHFFANNSTIFTDEKLEIIKRHDKIKNNFIFNSNFDFIRIPYKLKENEIINILDNYFNETLNETIIMQYILLVKLNENIYNKEYYYTKRNSSYFN